MPKQVLLEDARRVTAAAEKKAAEIGQPMNIAVADAGGNLVAHVRMDGAWIGSVDISIKKDVIQSLIHNDAFAIFVCAKHLSDLRDQFFARHSAGDLSDEDLAVLGARYDFGPDQSDEAVRNDRLISNAGPGGPRFQAARCFSCDLTNHR